ncbi:hypothetical protein B0H17DRAFT_1138837 [Mycena rosella]|uniref:Uncharacterized protein n=1 Tax=Mycena rosella TaxID=1033263 RepID=A0AAD7GBU1_MYCRO|nr:hypothetical protein B0H17DRAFT_1138837 [Mycena rosella]
MPSSLIRAISKLRIARKESIREMAISATGNRQHQRHNHMLVTRLVPIRYSINTAKPITPRCSGSSVEYRLGRPVADLADGFLPAIQEARTWITNVRYLWCNSGGHAVYTLQEGRVLDDDEKPMPDILSTGMAALTHGSSISPVAEFNQQFAILRERRRLTPVADLLLLERTASPGTAANADAPGNPVASAPTGDGTPTEDSDDTDSDGELSQDEELDALFLASPTLTRFDAADVSLDMDVEEMDLDGDDGGSGDDYEDDYDDVD